MQERGKRPGELTAEEAEALAASFRPAWEVEEEEEEAAEATSSPSIIPMRVIAIGDSAEPAAPVNTVIGGIVAPSQPPSEPPAVLRSSVPPIAVAADPFRSEAPKDEAKPVIPKHSAKNNVYFIVGLSIAACLGLFLKFALSDDKPDEPQVTQPAAPPPSLTQGEIPPPPAEEDLPPVKDPRATAEPASPAPSTPSLAQPASPREATETKGGKPSSPTPPKSPPKGGGGGIVRDVPF